MSFASARFARLGFLAASAALATASIAASLNAQGTAGNAPTSAPTPAPTPATAPTAAPPADPAKVEKGRELFAIWGCATCHALNDADATGHVGPGFDHNPGLSYALIVDRVTNGQGPMPAFGGQMTEQEISELAAYIDHVATR